MATLESEKQEVMTEIPDDIKCLLCGDLLQDAVLIPCCGNSFCDECVNITIDNQMSSFCSINSLILTIILISYHIINLKTLKTTTFLLSNKVWNSFCLILCIFPKDFLKIVYIFN